MTGRLIDKVKVDNFFVYRHSFKCSVEKFFRKENIHIRSYCLFLILPVTRRVPVCRMFAFLHNTYMSVAPLLGSPHVADSNPTMESFFDIFSDTPSHNLIFWSQFLIFHKIPDIFFHFPKKPKKFISLLKSMTKCKYLNFIPSF